VKYAEKYKIKPAWHPHTLVNDTNEVASVESMEKLLGISKMFAINLDIGHFTSGGGDALEFMKKHHDRITHIHVKDRKKGGPNVAWGDGDTPIKQALQLIRDNKWNIYAIQEREFRGPGIGTPLEETKKNMDYMRKALES
jgi:sugar phosphate isomerase/epimerase